jgi:hypothetical protein
MVGAREFSLLDMAPLREHRPECASFGQADRYEEAADAPVEATHGSACGRNLKCTEHRAR